MVLKCWIGQVLIYLIRNLSMKSVGKSVVGINTRIALPGPPQNLISQIVSTATTKSGVVIGKEWRESH